MELADRCESAGPEHPRELLMELWRILHGEPLVLFARDDIGSDYSTLRHILAAEAWESAALALRPAGWFLAAWFENGEGGARCTLANEHARVSARASTLALALLAAICRAEAQGAAS